MLPIVVFFFLLIFDPSDLTTQKHISCYFFLFVDNFPYAYPFPHRSLASLSSIFHKRPLTVSLVHYFGSEISALFLLAGPLDTSLSNLPPLYVAATINAFTQDRVTKTLADEHSNCGAPNPLTPNT